MLADGGRICFSDRFSVDRAKLLELDDELLELLRRGESLVFKGAPDGDVVLCTQDKTYALTFVETSNSVLLVAPPRESAERDVEAQVSGVLEVKSARIP